MSEIRRLVETRPRLEKDPSVDPSVLQELLQNYEDLKRQVASGAKTTGELSQKFTRYEANDTQFRNETRQRLHDAESAKVDEAREAREATCQLVQASEAKDNPFHEEIRHRLRDAESAIKARDAADEKYHMETSQRFKARDAADEKYHMETSQRFKARDAADEQYHIETSQRVNDADSGMKAHIAADEQYPVETSQRFNDADSAIKARNAADD